MLGSSSGSAGSRAAGPARAAARRAAIAARCTSLFWSGPVSATSAGHSAPRLGAPPPPDARISATISHPAARAAASLMEMSGSVANLLMPATILGTTCSASTRSYEQWQMPCSVRAAMCRALSSPLAPPSASAADSVRFSSSSGATRPHSPMQSARMLRSSKLMGVGARKPSSAALMAETVAGERRSAELCSSCCSASRKEHRICGSEALLTDCVRSVASWSMRALILLRAPMLRAALCRTCEACSLRHFMKVVCIWGTNGLRPTPALLMSKPIVLRMAALICQEKRSPMMRMSGPVIWTTKGLSVASSVQSTSSPSPSAASSRSSALLPCSTPCRYTGRNGASALGRHRPAT
mmetsp:Transcript_43207/g.109364  ORF Transcript_43207/g.109364 Transcript_43207/m.109364 type:complete len:353 (-) Transcript_43207:505-1563(-)